MQEKDRIISDLKRDKAYEDNDAYKDDEKIRDVQDQTVSIGTQRSRYRLQDAAAALQYESTRISDMIKEQRESLSKAMKKAVDGVEDVQSQFHRIRLQMIDLNRTLAQIELQIKINKVLL